VFCPQITATGWIVVLNQRLRLFFIDENERRSHELLDPKRIRILASVPESGFKCMMLDGRRCPCREKHRDIHVITCPAGAAPPRLPGPIGHSTASIAMFPKFCTVAPADTPPDHRPHGGVSAL
jgi:hypothetical protein